jgi:flagellar protein FlbB
MADKKGVPDRERTAAKAVNPPPQAPVKKRRFRAVLKVSLVLLVLLMLAGAGLAAAVYMKFLDVDAIAAQYKLASYPVIGRFFAKPPATNFETVDLPPEEPAEKPAAAPAPPLVAQAEPAKAPEKPLTSEELKAREAKAKQDEAKRISRLARLYGEMKPDEAVPIINQLDDPTVLAIFGKMDDSQVAKIMSLLDARRAARLTQDMLKGKTM